MLPGYSSAHHLVRSTCICIYMGQFGPFDINPFSSQEVQPSRINWNCLSLPRHDQSIVLRPLTLPLLCAVWPVTHRLSRQVQCQIIILDIDAIQNAIHVICPYFSRFYEGRRGLLRAKPIKYILWSGGTLKLLKIKVTGTAQKTQQDCNYLVIVCPKSLVLIKKMSFCVLPFVLFSPPVTCPPNNLPLLAILWCCGQTC